MAKNKSKNTKSLKIPKIILMISKILELISTKLATLFAAKLFTTPIKHKIPLREYVIDKESVKKTIKILAIKKEIVVYEFGRSERKVLLIHGWSGRGTQMFKIVENLIENGFKVISFDAPAHGRSKGSSSIMIDFIASILELEKQFGTFEFAIGHSLGGMALLNSVRENLSIKKGVIIGSGDIIQDIIDDFVKKLKLKPQIGVHLKNHFEKKYDLDMNYYSSTTAAANVEIPILIIHDKNDEEVNFKAAYAIKSKLKNSEIMITTGLGHRKILGNNDVIKRVIEFLK